MAWLNVVLPSIKLKHPHRQTPGAAEWPRLLQSSQGLKRNYPQAVEGPPGCQWLT